MPAVCESNCVDKLKIQAEAEFRKERAKDVEAMLLEEAKNDTKLYEQVVIQVLRTQVKKTKERVEKEKVAEREPKVRQQLGPVVQRESWPTAVRQANAPVYQIARMMNYQSRTTRFFPIRGADRFSSH